MKKLPTPTTATRLVRTIDATGKTLEQWKWEKEQEANRALKVIQEVSEYKRAKWGE